MRHRAAAPQLAGGDDEDMGQGTGAPRDYVGGASDDKGPPQFVARRSGQAFRDRLTEIMRNDPDGIHGGTMSFRRRGAARQWSTWGCLR
eukprot:6445390-Pyramimonas_sp.AAC.1